MQESAECDRCHRVRYIKHMQVTLTPGGKKFYACTARATCKVAARRYRAGL